MLKSLNDFRRRGLQQFKEAVFSVEQTTDPDFDWQMNRSVELEAQIRKILAAQQNYVSLVEQSCLAATNVAKEINHFYTMCGERMPQSAAKKTGRSWNDFKSGPRFATYDSKKLARDHAAARDLIRSQEILGAAAWQPAKAVYREEFAQPLATYLNRLPEIKKNAEERKTLILDFDSYRSRVKAMEETAGHDVSELIRLRKRLKESDEALQNLQRTLDTQLNVLTAYRPKLMKEVVDAFVALTIHYHERAAGSFRTIYPKYPGAASISAELGYRAAELRSRIQQQQQADGAPRLPNKPNMAVARHSMHQNRPFSHSAPPVTIETLPTRALDHKSMSFDTYHGQTAPKGRGGAGGIRGAAGVVLQQRGGSSMKYKPKTTQGSMKESMALQFQAAVARQQRGRQQQTKDRSQGGTFPAPPPRNHGKTAPELVHPSVLSAATKSASLGGAQMQAKASKPIVLTTHALAGKNDNELSFESGESITVLRKEANGWWYGKVVGSAVERAGWFPSTFVKSMSGRTFS